jgi:hypothetical protein
MHYKHQLAPQKSTSKITVPEAAAIMGVTPQFLRMGLRHVKFPFGTAVKFKRWSYYINAERFFSYLAGWDMDKHGQGQEREAINL